MDEFLPISLENPKSKDTVCQYSWGFYGDSNNEMQKKITFVDCLNFGLGCCPLQKEIEILYQYEIKISINSLLLLHNTSSLLEDQIQNEFCFRTKVFYLTSISLWRHKIEIELTYPPSRFLPLHASYSLLQNIWDGSLKSGLGGGGIEAKAIHIFWSTLFL